MARDALAIGQEVEASGETAGGEVHVQAAVLNLCRIGAAIGLALDEGLGILQLEIQGAAGRPLPLDTLGLQQDEIRIEAGDLVGGNSLVQIQRFVRLGERAPTPPLQRGAGVGRCWQHWARRREGADGLGRRQVRAGKGGTLLIRGGGFVLARRGSMVGISLGAIEQLDPLGFVDLQNASALRGIKLQRAGALAAIAAARLAVRAEGAGNDRAGDYHDARGVGISVGGEVRALYTDGGDGGVEAKVVTGGLDGGTGDAARHAFMQIDAEAALGGVRGVDMVGSQGDGRLRAQDDEAVIAGTYIKVAVSTRGQPITGKYRVAGRERLLTLTDLTDRENDLPGRKGVILIGPGIGWGETDNQGHDGHDDGIQATLQRFARILGQHRAASMLWVVCVPAGLRLPFALERNGPCVIAQHEVAGEVGRAGGLVRGQGSFYSARLFCRASGLLSGLLTFMLHGCGLLARAGRGAILLLAMLCMPTQAAEGDDVYARALSAIAEGRHGEARVLLSQVAATQPEHAGAWLDLAILHCAMGNRVEAEALFETIELRFAPGPALRELIARQRASGCQRKRLPAAVRVRLGRGHDSNANQGASNPNLAIGAGPGSVTLVLAPEYEPRGDDFTHLQVDGVLPLSADNLLGFGQLSVRRHDQVHTFDISALALGVEKRWEPNDWQMQASLAGGALELDGQLYQQSALIQGQVTPPLPLPQPWTFSLVAAQSYLAYADQPVFDARQAELRGVLRREGQRTMLGLAAGGLRDYGQGNRPGGDRHGWSVSAWGSLLLWGQATGEFMWSQQRWQGSRDYAPGLIELKRRQDVNQWRLALTQPLGGRHSLVAELRQLDNEENISIFGYRSRQFSLSWQMDY